MTNDNFNDGFLPPKHDKIKAPEGYFDRLPDKVMAQIKNESPKKGLILKLKPVFRWAAAAVLIGTISLFFILPRADKDDVLTSDENNVDVKGSENQNLSFETIGYSDVDEWTLYQLNNQQDAWMIEYMTLENSDYEIYTEL